MTYLFRKIVVIVIVLIFNSLTTTVGMANTQSRSANDIQAVDFSSVDQHALSAPKSVSSSTAKLAAYLVKSAKNDIEKARAIYRWITANISYDTDAFFSGRYRNKLVTAEQVLRSRRGVCDAYATLFVELAVLAGLQVTKVTGIAKGISYSRSQAMSNAENHAWNAVKLNGRWQLVDATWGAGIIDNNSRRFVRKFLDFYFLPQAQHIIFSHYPTDAQWQLVQTPLTIHQFDELVLLKPEFFSTGMQLASHRQAQLTVEGYVEVSLAVPEQVEIIANVFEQGTQLEKYYYYWERRSDKTTVKAVFPHPGRYSLRVFAKRKGQPGRYSQVLEYQVNATKGSEQRFPLFTKAYFDNRLKLHSHTQGVIHADGELQMSLEVPENVFLMARLTQGNNKLSRNLVFLQRDQGLYRIRSLFPQSGEYELQLFAKSRVNDVAVSALTYRVIARNSNTVQAAYPEYFVRFEEHNAQLFSPIKNQLSSGKEAFFKIKVPQAKQVAVKVGDQWHFLRQQGDVFSGHIPITKGVVKVLASFVNSRGEFSSLLRYTGI